MLKDNAHAPRVLISYAHESPAHEDSVLALGQRLRELGVDCWIDRFVPAPVRGWTDWMEREVARADFVLCCCTTTWLRRWQGEVPDHEGNGVKVEARLVKNLIGAAGGRTERFIPILLEPPENFRNGIPRPIPALLQDSSYYHITPDFPVDRPGPCLDLLCRLFGVELTRPNSIGIPPSPTGLRAIASSRDGAHAGNRGAVTVPALPVASIGADPGATRRTTVGALLRMFSPADLKLQLGFEYGDDYSHAIPAGSLTPTQLAEASVAWLEQQNAFGPKFFAWLRDLRKGQERLIAEIEGRWRALAPENWE